MTAPVSDSVDVSSDDPHAHEIQTLPKNEIFHNSLAGTEKGNISVYDNPSTPLCGYLYKFRNGTVLKTCKKRWFVFNESNCKLYYYKNPREQIALGEIDISQATFSIDVSDKLRRGLFSVSVPGRVYFLDASSRQACLFWLQELQKYRRINSTKVMAEKSPSVTGGRLQTGLLASVLSTDGISPTYVKEANNPLQDAQQKPQAHKPEDICLEDRDDTIRPIKLHKTKSKGFSVFKSLRKLHSSQEKSADGESHVSEHHQCSQCVALSKDIEILTDKVFDLQDEIATHGEVLCVLRQQLDIASKGKPMSIYPCPNNSDKNLAIPYENDVQIEKFTQENHEKMETLQRSLESEILCLKRNNELLQELLIQKDKAIMALTNEIYDLEIEKCNVCSQKRNGSVSVESRSMVIEHKESMDQLKDTVQALELQNKFLNDELVELNQLRRNSEEKCTEWEACCHQIHSKLLYLLNELQQTGGSSLSQEVISHILQEAVGGGTIHANFLPSWSKERVYDDLGFNWQWNKDDLLSQKASNLKQKSEDIINRKLDTELLSWHSKWDNFMVAIGCKELQRSQELKTLVRTGIPLEYRGQIWKECSLIWIKDHKASFGSNYYNNLLKSEIYNTKLDPYSKQIELDLLRTLPHNIHYESLDSDGIPKLRRVLLAFSRYCPDIGYCQGLNRLVAIALLFMEEEDAFWCLIAITQKIMPENYYSSTLIGSHVDQKVLKDLVADKLPRLHAHLEQNKVDISLFTFNWFFTIFVDNVPAQTYLQIWDVFLYEGSKVLFRYALAILKLCERDILQMKDYLSINKCLRSMSNKLIDVKKLTHIAFNELNPFPTRTIVSKRASHYPILQAQLQQLVSMRSSLSGAQEKVSSTDYDLNDDD